MNFHLWNISKRKQTPSNEFSLKSSDVGFLFRHRMPLEQWWLKLRPLLRILAKHESVYVSDFIESNVDEVDQ